MRGDGTDDLLQRPLMAASAVRWHVFLTYNFFYCAKIWHPEKTIGDRLSSQKLEMEALLPLILTLETIRHASRRFIAETSMSETLHKLPSMGVRGVFCSCVFPVLFCCQRQMKRLGVHGNCEMLGRINIKLIMTSLLAYNCFIVLSVMNHRTTAHSCWAAW